MSFAVVYTRACFGIKAPLVTVEAHLSNGLPGFSIVGLPEACVRESKDRIRSALINTGLEFPSRKITVNLAPADLPKHGAGFDLPIALGILAASLQIPANVLLNYEFAGELALSGGLRAIQGILPFALETHLAKRILLIPQCNANEASMIEDNIVYAATHLRQVLDHIKGITLLDRSVHTKQKTKPTNVTIDFSEVQGQSQAKRALEIAASGGHHILMVGSPGTGKSMLAYSFPSILSPLSREEALEVLSIYSLTSTQYPYDWHCRPFRHPHHSASGAALVGGGATPQPGEISLAHNGVLFLDELLEFKKSSLEMLREPMETGIISISRATKKLDFPAKFQLITAMNPCPCGFYGDKNKSCSCSPESIKRYQNRLSGPLLDRIDIQIEISGQASLFNNEIQNEKKDETIKTVETSKDIQKRVIKTTALQKDRCNKLNARMDPEDLKKYCKLDAKVELLMQTALKRFKFNARTYHRILKIARTIADCEESQNIEPSHLSEAISYRKMDLN